MQAMLSVVEVGKAGKPHILIDDVVEIVILPKSIIWGIMPDKNIPAGGFRAAVLEIVNERCCYIGQQLESHCLAGLALAERKSG